MPAATSERRAHAVPAHPTVRRHRRQVLRWALANAHPVDRDALAVLVAVRSDPSSGRVALEWQTDQVAHVLASAAPVWCRLHRVAQPPDLTTTLSTYLRFLSANMGLAAGSDTAAALRLAVADQRPSHQRSRARHPTSQLAPVLPIC